MILQDKYSAPLRIAQPIIVIAARNIFLVFLQLRRYALQRKDFLDRQIFQSLAEFDLALINAGHTVCAFADLFLMVRGDWRFSLLRLLYCCG
jgi:hypothetical protein